MRKRILISVLIILITGAADLHAQSRSPFTIGNVTAEAGTMESGFVDVPAGVDEGSRIPITIIHGAREGKTLMIMSGVHGSEYAPILALQGLRKQIDPASITGTVVLVHIANMPSFLKRTVYYGPDGKNLNRVFPGKANGTITERIAYVLTEKLIRRADYFVDVHSGDNNESLRQYVVYYESEAASRELIDTSRRMALATDIDVLKIARGRSTDFAAATYTTNAALLLGKASIAIESGELGKPEPEAIARSERSLINLMRELGMLPGKPVKFKVKTIVGRDQTLRSTIAGLYYSLVVRDQRVRKDQLLGYVTDFFGNRVQEVRAPFAGVVMYYTATPAISEGEPLVNLGEIETQKR